MCVLFVPFPQLKSAPEDYDEVYLEMARRGARVLALAHKHIGPKSHQEVCKIFVFTFFSYLFKPSGN